MLASLTFCGCDINGDDGQAVTINTTMMEAEFSKKKLGIAGALILAAFMSTKLFKAKGALTKLDISENCLTGKSPLFDTSGLAALAKSIGNLKELNISNNFLKAEGAKALWPLRSKPAEH